MKIDLTLAIPKGIGLALKQKWGQNGHKTNHIYDYFQAILSFFPRKTLIQKWIIFLTFYVIIFKAGHCVIKNSRRDPFPRTSTDNHYLQNIEKVLISQSCMTIH